MDQLADLQKSIEYDLAAARELALLRAFMASKGVTEVVVPSAKTREVTEADRALVPARRDAVSELIWLHHERDAVCVETGLIPAQVANILGSRTRTAAAPEPPAEVASTIPPARLSLGGADADRPPPSACKEYDVDDIDRKQVIAARKRIPENEAGAWNGWVHGYATRRRLTTQQVAGIVAVAKRKGLLAA